MRSKRRLACALLVAVVSALATLGACQLFAGIGDVDYVAPGPPDSAAHHDTGASERDAREAAAKVHCDAGVACDAECVDLLTNDENCGGCGMACASCTAGRCVVVLAKTDADAIDLALSQGKVYWTAYSDSGVVMETPATGGASTTVVGGQGEPDDLVVQGSVIYWTDFGAGTVNELVLGGSPVQLANQQSGPRAIVMGGSVLLWSNYNGGTLTAATVVDAAITSEAVSGKLVTPFLTTDGTHVYGAVPATNSVVTISFATAAATTIATSQLDPQGIAVDETRVYWTTSGSVDAGVSAAVVAVPLDGGLPVTLTTNTSHPRPIVVDDRTIYWADSVAGTILSMPKSGGPITTLAAGPATPTHIALDDASVYWTTGSGGTVMKVTPK